MVLPGPGIDSSLPTIYRRESFQTAYSHVLTTSAARIVFSKDFEACACAFSPSEPDMLLLMSPHTTRPARSQATTRRIESS